MVKYWQMKEILTALMIWLGANTGLDTNHDIPKVLFLSQEKMEKLYYVDERDQRPNELHGLYDTNTNTIVLPDTWDRRKAWDLGVLIHEMVHYLQDMNEMKFACSREMEKILPYLITFWRTKKDDIEFKEAITGIAEGIKNYIISL